MLRVMQFDFSWGLLNRLSNNPFGGRASTGCNFKDRDSNHGGAKNFPCAAIRSYGILLNRIE